MTRNQSNAASVPSGGSTGQVLTKNSNLDFDHDWEDGVKVATVTLTSAQLKALNTTPVQIIPAPGAGKVIALLGGFAQYIFGTVAYTVTGAGGSFYIVYHGLLPHGAIPNAFQGSFPDAGFVDQTRSLGDQLYYPNGQQGPNWLSAIANVGIDLTIEDVPHPRRRHAHADALLRRGDAELRSMWLYRWFKSELAWWRWYVRSWM